MFDSLLRYHLHYITNSPAMKRDIYKYGFGWMWVDKDISIEGEIWLLLLLLDGIYNGSIITIYLQISMGDTSIVEILDSFNYLSDYIACILL